MYWAFFPSKVISPCSKPLVKNWQKNWGNKSPFTLPFPYILLQAHYCCFTAFAPRPGLQMLLPNALSRVAFPSQIVNRDGYVNTTSVHSASVVYVSLHAGGHWLLISEWSWYVSWLLNSCGHHSLWFLNHYKVPAKNISFCSNTLAGSYCLLADTCSTDGYLDSQEQN